MRTIKVRLNKMIILIYHHHRIIGTMNKHFKCKKLGDYIKNFSCSWYYLLYILYIPVLLVLPSIYLTCILLCFGCVVAWFGLIFTKFCWDLKYIWLTHSVSCIFLVINYIKHATFLTRTNRTIKKNNSNKLVWIVVASSLE